MPREGWVAVVSFLALFLARPVLAVSYPDESQTLGKTIPFAKLWDESGHSVDLHEFQGEPLLVVPLYTDCHMSCPTIAEALKRGTEGIRKDLKYRVLLFSFDPKETGKGLRHFRSMHELPAGWVLARSDSKGIDELLGALDYHTLTTDSGISHPNVIVALNGRLQIAKYIYGTEFPSKVLEGALLSSATSKSDSYFGFYVVLFSIFGMIGSASFLTHYLRRK